jgi:hypothetical protein
LINLGQWSNELEVKDTTYTDPEKSASYLDLHLEIDNGCRSKTKPYDRNDEKIMENLGHCHFKDGQI